MALESGFFNSVNNDRLYNARDISRYFENVLSSGIFKRIDNCFKVSAFSGMNLTVAPGAGLIDCQWFRSEIDEGVTVPTAHAVLPRFDNVVARLDLSDSVRAITLMVVSGTPSETPTAPDPVRTATIYDLVLALVYVPAGATEIVEANLTDVRSNDWYCGYVHSLVDTPVLKTYNARYVAASDNTTVAPISIVGFNPLVDILNVYVNGFKLAPEIEYTLNETTSSITLAEPVDADTIIDFEAFRPIMPDDVPGLADTVTEMVQTTSTMQGDVDTAKASVEEQKTKLTEATNNVEALQSEVATLKADLAKVAPITAGDFEFGEAFIVTGFASSQSTRLYFSIPFNRPIIATTCTIKTMKVTARQSESYVLGSASGTYEIAGDVYSTRISNNGMLTLVIEPTFSVAPFNNAEVSIYVNAGAVVTFA